MKENPATRELLKQKPDFVAKQIHLHSVIGACTNMKLNAAAQRVTAIWNAILDGAKATGETTFAGLAGNPEWIQLRKALG